jgi:hypothetical protein
MLLGSGSCILDPKKGHRISIFFQKKISGVEREAHWIMEHCSEGRNEVNFIQKANPLGFNTVRVRDLSINPNPSS